MRLRPELVLLQKTMVTVEGVARRIDPDHDIWAAAEPVVARWIAARALAGRRRLRDFARDARAAVSALAQMAERDAASPAPRRAANRPRSPGTAPTAAVWSPPAAALTARSPSPWRVTLPAGRRALAGTLNFANCRPPPPAGAFGFALLPAVPSRRGRRAA